MCGDQIMEWLENWVKKFGLYSVDNAISLKIVKKRRVIKNIDF